MMYTRVDHTPLFKAWELEEHLKHFRITYKRQNKHTLYLPKLVVCSITHSFMIYRNVLSAVFDNSLSNCM